MSNLLDFILNESIHFFITGLIAAYLFWRFRDWRLVLVAFITGVFIDVDHWFDYFAHHGFKISLRNIFQEPNYLEMAGKIYLLFHGWEFIALFWLVGYWWGKKKKIKGLQWAMALPHLGHLVWDHLSFSHHPLTYSFLFRWFNQFNLERII